MNRFNVDDEVAIRHDAYAGAYLAGTVEEVLPDGRYRVLDEYEGNEVYTEDQLGWPEDLDAEHDADND